jgi:hypothetical protein
VEPEAGFKALQSHLKAARAARDAGALDQAREHVDAALAIDPNFLAAQVLRESVVAARQTAEPPPVSAPALADESVEPELWINSSLSAPASHPPLPPPASHLSLEERVRLRRVDHCIGVARSAIVERRLRDASTAISEAAELAPDTPALNALAVELASLRRDTWSTHRGVWIVAAAVLVAAVLAAWPRQRKPALLMAHRIAGSATLVSPTEPVLNSQLATANNTPIATGTTIATGGAMPVEGTTPAIERQSFSETTRRTDAQTTAGSSPRGILPTPEVRLPSRDEAPAPVAERRPPPPALPESVVVTLAAAAAAATPPPPAAPPPSPAAALPRPAAAALAPAESVAVPAAAPVPMVDDSSLIRETLERYRRAYNGLDARLAHAVYPGVDLTALERAFDDLRSQSLQFDTCSLEVRGVSARATCRGSARYVPKIGSREPRAERRIWTFRLDKDDRDWKIASAWAER